MPNPRPLVAIEGPDIVIRIAIDALPTAYSVGADMGNVTEGFTMTDAPKFAKYVVNALLEEDEEGTTDVHRIFDKAMVLAVENGAEGVEEAPAEGNET